MAADTRSNRGWSGPDATDAAKRSGRERSDPGPDLPRTFPGIRRPSKNTVRPA